ncbi:MAG TPA: fibronectin type III domain-containing protein, partial [Gemmataceae bacterium]|nr:fibronectin type III domain-containing protein [Gemmataceae bacterium]
MADNVSHFPRRRWFSQGRSKRRPTSRLVLELLEDRRAPAVSAHFAVIGDYGTGQQQEQAVANLVQGWKPDFITTAGDNCYLPPPTTAASYDTTVGQYYHNFIYPYTGSYGPGASTNAFFPSMGEHDWGANGANPTGDQGYLNFFTGLPGNQRYYTVTQGPVALFVLDTDPNEPDGTSSISTQAQWLQGALASSTAPWKLVVMAFPPYSSGDEGSTGGLQWPFQAWGASAVISGHDHDYERLIENGLPYFVDAAGGAGLESTPSTFIAGSQAHANVFGALKVDASPSQITFSFANTAGTVLDSYSMNYALPAAPSSLAATAVSGTQINLKWTDNSTNETGYDIERSTDGTTFTSIATASPATTNYLDAGLTAGTTYYYRVAAVNAGGKSAYSNTAKA